MSFRWGVKGCCRRQVAGWQSRAAWSVFEAAMERRLQCNGSRSKKMQRRVLRLLAEHHPFYLLSALCMLAGCYTLSHVLALEPGEIGKLLVLLATLNVYEAL